VLKWVYDTLTNKNPLQLQFTFALWTGKMIGQIIYQRVDIPEQRQLVFIRFFILAVKLFCLSFNFNQITYASSEVFCQA
jgi:hypothetical protein